MRRAAFFVQVVVLSHWLVWAAGAEVEPLLSFNSYAQQLRSINDIIFVATCVMENGDRGIMIFRQLDQGGTYFQLKNNQTIRSEHLVLVNGGVEIKNGSATRDLGNGDEAIKTLIRSYPYFMMPAYEIESVLRVPPQGKCFEHPP